MQEYYQSVLSQKDEDLMKSPYETSNKSLLREKSVDSAKKDRPKKLDYGKGLEKQFNTKPIKVNNKTFKSKVKF